MSADVCLHAEAGLFLSRLIEYKDRLARGTDVLLCDRIKTAKALHQTTLRTVPVRKCGIDPLAVVAALGCHLPDDAMLFTDVTASEHLAAEFFRIARPRTSIPTQLPWIARSTARSAR